MEVLSGVLRRRHWSAELKEQIVSETLELGVPLTEVARRHALDRSLVYCWRRELGVTRLAGPAKLMAVEVAENAPVSDPLPCKTQATDLGNKETPSTFRLRFLQISLPIGLLSLGVSPDKRLERVTSRWARRRWRRGMQGCALLISRQSIVTSTTVVVDTVRD